MKPSFSPASSPGAGSGPNLCLFEGSVAQLFSCFFLFMFSNLLSFSFLFIGNRKAVTPQGFPGTRLQHCCPLVAPAHGGSKIFAMCYVPTGVFILSQKLRPNATCWAILVEKHIWQNDRTSLWCMWISLNAQGWRCNGPGLVSETFLAEATPSEDMCLLHWSKIQTCIHLNFYFYVDLLSGSCVPFSNFSFLLLTWFCRRKFLYFHYNISQSVVAYKHGVSLAWEMMGLVCLPLS